MPATYEPIATTTLGSAASSITFSSIPATYTDLRVVLTWIATNTASSVTPHLRFNSDGTASYSTSWLSGNGTAASSSRATGDDGIKLLGGVYPSSPTIPVLTTIDIFSYAGSTFKTVLANTSADNNGSGFETVSVGLWRKTNAVTTVNVDRNGNGSYDIGTTATLYGIKNA